MKKIILSLILSAPLAASAQITGDGYYRVKNNASERFITITDDIVGEVNMSSTTADLSNITTWRGFDYVKSNPASVIYIEAVGKKFNLKGQGTSIYDISGGRVYIDIKSKNKDNTNPYYFSITYSGAEFRLYDNSTKKDKGGVDQTGDVKYSYWNILPITDDDYNYLGLQPTVKAGDDWYGTIYASYPFKVASEGVTLYYVDGVKDGEFQLKEITSEVKPASTPMVFKCSSYDPSDNRIIPVADLTTAPTDNLMGGTLFASSIRKHIKRVEFDATTMRVLDSNSNGDLIFTTAKPEQLTDESYIPMNTAWLNVPSGLSGDFKLVSRDDFTGIRNIDAPKERTDNAIYTLTGVRQNNTNSLRKGIYISNGKKIVIR